MSEDKKHSGGLVKLLTGGILEEIEIFHIGFNGKEYKIPRNSVRNLKSINPEFGIIAIQLENGLYIEYYEQKAEGEG